MMGHVIKGRLYDEFFDPLPLLFLIAVMSVLTIVVKCTHPVANQQMDIELGNMPNIIDRSL
jgi:hypothetical protein